MTHPVWPLHLPQTRRDGYGYQPVDHRRRRAIDVGAPIYESRHTLTVGRMSLSVTVTQPQRGAFWWFFNEDCQRGKGLFWLPDPMRDGWPLQDDAFADLQLPDGSPWLDEARLLCRWADGLPSEGRWRGTAIDIEFDLWVMP